MTTLRDDLGRVVQVPVPARRIISLAPSVSENLFAIGAGGRVIGVSNVDDYPPAVTRLPRTGDFSRPSVERIRALRPDLVLVESATANRAAIENLQARLKAPVFALQTRRFADVPRALLLLGRITGSVTGARQAADVMQRKATRVARRLASRRPARVFVEINAVPLYAAGPGTFIDDLIRRAGGVNIVRGTNPFPVFSKEALLAADPEHYVIASGGDMAARGAPAFPPPLNRLAAVRRGHVHRIPADLLLRPTPRLADGLVALARALHP